MKQNIKKLLVLGLTCSFLLTGCGVSDHVAGLTSEIDVDTLSTEEEIMRAADQPGQTRADTEWVISKSHQQQIQELEQYIREQEKAGIVASQDEDGEEFSAFLQKISNGEPSGDEWWVSLEGKKRNILQFAGGLEKLGYAGMTEWFTRSLEFRHEYSECTNRGVKFQCLFEDGNEGCIDINVPQAYIRYPVTMKEIVESPVTDAFSLSGAVTGGYVEGLHLYSGTDLERGSFYSKDCAVYLKDGEIIQLEFLMRKSYEVAEMQQEKKLGKENAEFFTETERASLQELLMHFGVDGNAAGDFLSKIGTSSGKSGDVGSRKWTLEKETENGNGWMIYDDTYESWFLRIQ